MATSKLQRIKLANPAAATAAAAVAPAGGTGLLNFSKNLVGGLFNVGRGTINGSRDAFTALRGHINVTPEQAVALRDAALVGGLGYGGYRLIRADPSLPQEDAYLSRYKTSSLLNVALPNTDRSKVASLLARGMSAIDAAKKKINDVTLNAYVKSPVVSGIVDSTMPTLHRMTTTGYVTPHNLLSSVGGNTVKSLVRSIDPTSKTVKTISNIGKNIVPIAGKIAQVMDLYERGVINV